MYIFFNISRRLTSQQKHSLEQENGSQHKTYKKL